MRPRRRAHSWDHSTKPRTSPLHSCQRCRTGSSPAFKQVLNIKLKSISKVYGYNYYWNNICLEISLQGNGWEWTSSSDTMRVGMLAPELQNRSSRRDRIGEETESEVTQQKLDPETPKKIPEIEPDTTRAGSNNGPGPAPLLGRQTKIISYTGILVYLIFRIISLRFLSLLSVSSLAIIVIWWIIFEFWQFKDIKDKEKQVDSWAAGSAGGGGGAAAA